MVLKASYTIPVLTLLTGLLIVAQIILGGYDPVLLVQIIAITGFLACGIWHIVARYFQNGGSHIRTLIYVWPLLFVFFDFIYFHFPHSDQTLWWKYMLHAFAFLGMQTIVLSSWQQKRNVVPYITGGLAIGLLSAVLPNTLLWLFLLPSCFYNMRCWSARNVWGAFTGTALGIWTVYAAQFLTNSETVSYAGLWRFSLPEFVTSLGIPEWLFIAVVVLMSLLYGFRGLLPTVGKSVRSQAGIIHTTMICFTMIVLSIFDLEHLPLYLCLHTLSTAQHIAICQSNAHYTGMGDWWALVIILCGIALNALPYVITLTGL